MVSHHKNSDVIFAGAEQKIVREPLQVYAPKRAKPLSVEFRMLGCVFYEMPKLGIKIVGQFGSGNILVISHDRVDFGEDARMEDNLHFERLLLILLSKAAKETPNKGLASSSESLRLASASPLSGSENNAGRESIICRASVALCGSGSSRANFFMETSVLMGKFWQLLREIRIISARCLAPPSAGCRGACRADDCV